MGETEELIAALDSILLEMVEAGELELATRRGALSIAGPLLTLLETHLDELRAGTLDLGDWLLDRREVVELFVDGAAVAARLAPFLARLDGDAAAGAQHHPELVAAIARDLDDVAARLVYADWLTERGDPRGDLIAVGAALRERPDDPRLRDREARLLAEHRSHFLGQLPDDPELFRARFHLGWLDEVHIGPEETRDSLAELATLESARFLRTLTVDGGWQIDASCALFTARALRAHLDSLRVGGENALERLSLAWLDPSPRLATLDVHAYQVALDAPLPSLRRLRCREGTVDLAPLRSPPATLPALEELDLGTCELVAGGDTFPPDLEPLAALLDDPPPRLRRLVLPKLRNTNRNRDRLERRFADSRLGRNGATLVLEPIRRPRYDDVAE